MSHHVLNINLLIQTFYGFIAFSCCASSVYIINDVLDLEADRCHSHKKNRPFAAELVSVSAGLFALVPLIFVTLLFSLLLSLEFLYVLGIYFSLSLFYSLYLKKLVLIDVLILSALYVLRIFAGIAAINVTVSNWLLAFSLFFFLSLALVKRYVELKENNHQQVLAARGYLLEDTNMLALAGIASGYVSILVIAFYVNSEKVMQLYRHPFFLWLLCPLLIYWISRIWLFTGRGMIQSEPLNFCMTDKVSYFVGLLLISVLFIAT